MKKYTYTGSSILAFTHEGKDYVIHGEGPHELPEESSVVKAHIGHKTLTEYTESPKENAIPALPEGDGAGKKDKIITNQ